MRVLLIRHAIAVPGGPDLPDHDRPLSEEGIRRFRRGARGLAKIVDVPEGILTSPLPRARQTAEIASRAWGGAMVREAPALAGGRPGEVLELLEGRGGCVALVGHEPHLSILLGGMLGVPSAALAFKKGGAALVEMPEAAGAARLVWFLSPRVLRQLGGE